MSAEPYRPWTSKIPDNNASAKRRMIPQARDARVIGQAAYASSERYRSQE